MDRLTALMVLAGVATCQGARGEEAVTIARNLLDEREPITEADLPDLLDDAKGRALGLVWAGSI